MPTRPNKRPRPADPKPPCDCMARVVKHFRTLEALEWLEANAVATCGVDELCDMQEASYRARPELCPECRKGGA